MSQHLKVLKEVGLVFDRPVGTRRVYQVDPQAVAALREYFDAFWGSPTQGDLMPPAQGAAVRHSITVDTSQENAFAAFTSGHDRGWPREFHIGGATSSIQGGPASSKTSRRPDARLGAMDTYHVVLYVHLLSLFVLVSGITLVGPRRRSRSPSGPRPRGGAGVAPRRDKNPYTGLSWIWQ